MGQEGGVHILGQVHGALFVAYVVLALVLWRKNEWSSRTLTIVLVDSVLPAGGLWVARRADLDARQVAALTP